MTYIPSDTAAIPGTKPIPADTVTTEIIPPVKEPPLPIVLGSGPKDFCPTDHIMLPRGAWDRLREINRNYQFVMRYIVLAEAIEQGLVKMDEVFPNDVGKVEEYMANIPTKRLYDIFNTWIERNPEYKFNFKFME